MKHSSTLDHVSYGPLTQATFMLEEISSAIKKIGNQRLKNTSRIVSIVVSTLEAQNYPDLFDIIQPKSKNSHLEKAKIEYESP